MDNMSKYGLSKDLTSLKFKHEDLFQWSEENVSFFCNYLCDLDLIQTVFRLPFFGLESKSEAKVCTTNSYAPLKQKNILKFQDTSAVDPFDLVKLGGPHRLNNT